MEGTAERGKAFRSGCIGDKIQSTDSKPIMASLATTNIYLATTEKLYDNLDFQRAVQACLLALPPVNQLASRLALGDIRVGAAVAEDFPGRIHHRAAAGFPGGWRANQSNEVAFSGQRNRAGVSIPVRLR